ncbi:MAG TPA: hypothetical protein VL157_14605 [Gemmatimonadaceae bacterium]|jgi:hypothetical protein|nr:hypothetical protein [Gemmatimonadaceae bacterium]
MQRKPTAIEGAPIVPEDVGEGEDARIDELSGVVAADAGSRLTPQQRAAARRELERLLDKLVADIKHRIPGPGAAAAAEQSESALLPYRSPDRCVVQGAERAVSVSWFAAQFTDVSLGELQVIEWRGVVAVRGATRRRESAAATILRADVYRQVQTADGWGWQPSASNDAVMSTDDLAAACLAPLLLPPAAG